MTISFILRVDSPTTPDVGLSFIPSHCYIIRSELTDQLQRQRGKAVDPARRSPIGSREMRHGIIPPVEKRFTIDQDKDLGLGLFRRLILH